MAETVDGPERHEQLRRRCLEFDDVDALAEHAYETFGATDVLCNNAGVFAGGFMWERPPSDFEWTLGVNLWGILNAIRAFVPRMIAAGTPAHIVNTTSMAGMCTNAFSGPYTVSKFAAQAATECLAHDLRADRRADQRVGGGSGRGRHAHRGVEPEPARVARGARAPTTRSSSNRR